MGKIFVMKKKAAKSTIEYENLLFCFVIAFRPIHTMFCKFVRMLIANPMMLDHAVIYGVLVFLLIKAWPKFKHTIMMSEFICVSIYVVIWIGSYLAAKGYGNEFREIVSYIVQNCLLIWLVARVVRIDEKLIQYMRLFSYVFLVYFPLEVYLWQSTDSWTNNYSQANGYLLLTGFLLLNLPLVLGKKWYDFIAAAVYIIFTILCGARGPFITLLVTLLLSLFMVSIHKKTIIKALPVVAIVVFIISKYMQQIIDFLLDVTKAGGSTRIIQSLLDDELLTNLTERERFLPIVGEFIRDHILTGCGFVNDRIYISERLGIFSDVTANYAHNIFLEIIMQLGVIFGVIVILLLIKLIADTFRSQKTVEGKLFYFGLVCIAIFPLLGSGSHLTSTTFYALIGFSFAHKEKGTFVLKKGKSGVSLRR